MMKKITVAIAGLGSRGLQTYAKCLEKYAKEDEIPVVMHRKDRKPWLVTCNLDDFMRFYKAWLKEWEE